jgi:hypothetical protein
MGHEQVDWRQPIKLRGGGAVRLYHAEGGGDNCVHGAYYTGDRWIPSGWCIDGSHRPDKKKSSLDIINEERKEAA